VFHHQAHDPAETEIGGLGLVRGRYFRFCPRRLLANFGGSGDAEIMRDCPRNNNPASRPSGSDAI